MWKPIKSDQRNAHGETAQQIIGAFMMHMGQAPWEAENLLDWLHRAGFAVVLKVPLGTGVPSPTENSQASSDA